jgi:hypothetical protein
MTTRPDDSQDFPRAMQGTAPALTVALFTPGEFSSIRRTVSHVAAQDIAAKIELLVLTSTPELTVIDATAVSALHSVRLVPVSYGDGSGSARAAAVREAAAPIIAFGEDHCFPQPGWATALVEAHRGPWAAVGPIVDNANPTTLVSWADMLMGYGPWMAVRRAGEHDHLPGHNTSYKREVLLSFGDDLDALIEAETPLQWRLRAQGHRLYQDKNARVAHTNFERWQTWLFVSMHAGRVFASTRARDWPAVRRVMFAFASPLIPFVRLQRHLRQAVSADLPASLVARVAPVLFVGLVSDAIGQGLGSLLGAGRSRSTLVAWEFDRNAPNRPASLASG